MKETGEVIKLEGNIAYLVLRRMPTRAESGAREIAVRQNTGTVRVSNILNAAVGDNVEVEFSSADALKSSLLVYMLPLIMLFAGMWLGYVLPQNLFELRDVLAAIMGLAFAAIALVVIKLLSPFFRRKLANVYTMVRIESGSEDAS